MLAEQGTFSLRLSNPSLELVVFDTSDFETYPNPVTDILNISYNKTSPMFQYLIYWDKKFFLKQQLQIFHKLICQTFLKAHIW
jgi:hypothetical protein